MTGQSLHRGKSNAGRSLCPKCGWRGNDPVLGLSRGPTQWYACPECENYVIDEDVKWENKTTSVLAIVRHAWRLLRKLCGASD